MAPGVQTSMVAISDGLIIDASIMSTAVMVASIRNLETKLREADTAYLRDDDKICVTLAQSSFADWLMAAYTPPMSIVIRDIEADDLHAVLDLNEVAVPHVNSVNLEQMHWFSKNALFFRVARQGTKIVAFLVGLGPGKKYQSLNYRWFCDRYQSFIYVDRIVVAGTARRSGLATRLYDDFAATAPDNVNVMACEVNIKPANDTSMQFHLRRGFRQVGSQATEGGKKEVALLVSEL